MKQHIEATSLLDAQFERSDALAQEGAYEEAAQLLDGLLQVSMLPLLKRLAICKHHLGDMAAARKALEQAHALAPADVDVLISLGDLCLGEQDFRLALDYFTQAVQHAPTELDAAVGLFYAADGRGDASAREKAVRLVSQIDPHHPLLADGDRVPRPASGSGSCFDWGRNFFGPVILNPSTLAATATSLENWQELLSFYHLFATDPNVAYVDAYNREGVKRFGKHWRYFDIGNVLFAASKLIQPRRYLEIGVRRGRSACIVARACPTVDIAAFDMWIQNYAGIENPGSAFVASELKKHGHVGEIAFFDGNSHETVPAYFRRHPDAKFDLITVDGDHSEEGALDDLCNVIPHLAPGGVLVFDDISHPLHPFLVDVWRTALQRFPQLSGFEFTETGYGVAFAIAKS